MNDNSCIKFVIPLSWFPSSSEIPMTATPDKYEDLKEQVQKIGLTCGIDMERFEYVKMVSLKKKHLRIEKLKTIFLI